ncbi:CBS domain-containing protein [bacterium]|nr:CBS domain-containing protein [bacterium]
MGLRLGLENDRVADLRLRIAIRILPLNSVRQAVLLMKTHGIGCVFLTDANDKPLGIFTEAHLLRLLRDRPEGLHEPVGRHVAHHVESISEDASIEQLIRLMQSKDLRFVAVTDQAGRLVGVTGQKSLMEYVAEYYPNQVMVARTASCRSLQREGA